VRCALLDRRNLAGHWAGHLSSSALGTATAVVAIATARDAGVAPPEADGLVRLGLHWLVATRNEDGGWGDTPDSVSNISTTALVWSALAFGETPPVRAAADSAEGWIRRAAGGAPREALPAALAARYGQDRTFSVPILTMCAIAGRLGAGRAAWERIPSLPFELAAFPRGFFAVLRLPVVSYALPALIAIGLVRYRRGPRVPIVGGWRSWTVRRVLRVLETLQPAGGGFLEAVPLTSFVTMSLAAAGEARHPVVARALAFLTRSVRTDGSWPIDTNLATWVTTLSVNALAAGGTLHESLDEAARRRLRDWLLAQQWTVEHPYTGAAPGGWAWTDLSGGVPDADDTAGALVALRHLDAADPKVRAAAANGVRWLNRLQNRDGGIPTFCRGWGTLPFDRSAAELTAHALRAWCAWAGTLDAGMKKETEAAIVRGIAFLQSAQRSDGAFVPLWFGNQHEPHEENPVYGTSRVISGLLAAVKYKPAETAEMVVRARRWLISAQRTDGGWGAAPGGPPSVEETALAIDALTRSSGFDCDSEAAVVRGLAWLDAHTDGGRRFEPAPLGLYFARLWYSEELYPLIFTAAACEASV
jgi:squalene-hopene/tetraprenyl-beta-curcumene cyclase